jgi:hypothetical protein
MFKQIIAAVFLFVFAAQIFSKAAIVVNFYANQSYIAKNLCINRAKPEMHCCGKCQLSKRLKQEDNKDRQNPNRKIEKGNEVISSKSFFASYQFHNMNADPKSFPAYLAGKSVDRSQTVFHPPAA